MASEYRVTILTLARRDLQEQFDFISSHSPQGAAAWYQQFWDALARLSQNPFLHATAPENPHVADEVRQILFRTTRGLSYRILFTISGHELRVLRVRGPGQDLLRESDLS